MQTRQRSNTHWQGLRRCAQESRSQKVLEPQGGAKQPVDRLSVKRMRGATGRWVSLGCLLLGGVACQGSGAPEDLLPAAPDEPGAADLDADLDASRAAGWDEGLSGLAQEEDGAGQATVASFNTTTGWDPSWTGNPRILFRATDKDKISARLKRTDEPFVTLASRIRSSCNQTPAVYDDADGLDQAAIYTNGNIARNCAFIAYIEGNTTAAAKARDILLSWPSDLGRLSDETFDNTDIHVGEALSQAVEAYDLLKGTTLVSSSDFSTIEDNILGMARSTWNIYVKYFGFYYKYQNNNHKGKVAAALGLVGMTLNFAAEADDYVEWAVPELDFVLGHQTTDQGGFAEGTYYLTYGSETYLPFLISYHAWAQGKSVTYHETCQTWSRVLGCQKGDITVPDFLANPEIQTIYDWWVSIVMPDGMAPDYDDANRWGFHGGVWSGLYNSPAMRAAWERNQTMKYYDRGCQDLSVESLVNFPDTLAAAWPSYTSKFSPKAGTGVFRSSWANDARYLLLLAEHDNQIHGGHEQPDGTAILLHAYGEYLVIDSGYGSWSQRKEVSAPENHSLVLIDDQGPHDNAQQAENGADTYLERCSATAGFEHCDAVTTFSDVTQARTVYFLENESFVVIDRMGPGNANITHSYTSLWQLNTGGNTTGVLTKNAYGGVATRSKASLAVAVGGTQGMPVLSWDTMSHAATYGVLDTHDVLKARTTGNSLTLVGVLEPAPTGAPVPALKTLQSGSGVVAIKGEEGSRVTLTIVTDAGATARVTTTSSGLPEVVTDADFAWLEFQSGTLVKVHQEGATVLTVNGVSAL